MFSVLFSVELGYNGETEGDFIFMFGMGVEPDKVLNNLLIALAGIGLVDGRCHVLDVDDEGVDEGDDFLQVMARHVEARLHRKLPFLRTLLANSLVNALRKSGSPPTKADAASCRQEIKIVHLHVHHHAVPCPSPAIRRRLRGIGVEAILAMERASVECHEGGDTLAVYRKAVAVDANEWGGLHFILI